MANSPRGRDGIIGSLRESAGKGVVRMEASFDSNVDDVWSALTDPRRLATWLGDVEGDLRFGGAFRAFFVASGWQGTGRVEACDPPRSFRVRTKDPDEPGEHVTEATLTADGDQTVLVLEERGMPVEQLAAYGAGVQIHVEDLADHLAGRERSTDEGRWNELLPRYQALAAADR